MGLSVQSPRASARMRTELRVERAGLDRYTRQQRTNGGGER
jgi:hypothetical protein